MNVRMVFIFFSSVLVICSVGVVVLQNTVFSLISLIGSFVASSGLLLSLECEFFAFLFIMIYVGAIAVLFLFVVMMLDVKYVLSDKRNPIRYFIFGLFVASGFFYLIDYVLLEYFKTNPYDPGLSNQFNTYFKEDATLEVVALGQILYTHFIVQFLLAGLILFLALMGVVVLTTNLTNKSLATDTKQVSRVTGL